jgi:hypothetical protein
VWRRLGHPRRCPWWRRRRRPSWPCSSCSGSSPWQRRLRALLFFVAARVSRDSMSPVTPSRTKPGSDNRGIKRCSPPYDQDCWLRPVGQQHPECIPSLGWAFSQVRWWILMGFLLHLVSWVKPQLTAHLLSFPFLFLLLFFSRLALSQERVSNTAQEKRACFKSYRYKDLFLLRIANIQEATAWCPNARLSIVMYSDLVTP